MLVLSRRAGEVIRIGDDIRIMIVRTGPLSVRVGIQAPRDLNILREELKPKEESEVKNEVS